MSGDRTNPSTTDAEAERGEQPRGSDVSRVALVEQAHAAQQARAEGDRRGQGPGQRNEGGVGSGNERSPETPGRGTGPGDRVTRSGVEGHVERVAPNAPFASVAAERAWLQGRLQQPANYPGRQAEANRLAQLEGRTRSDPGAPTRDQQARSAPTQEVGRGAETARSAGGEGTAGTARNIDAGLPDRDATAEHPSPAAAQPTDGPNRSFMPPGDEARYLEGRVQSSFEGDRATAESRLAQLNPDRVTSNERQREAVLVRAGWEHRSVGFTMVNAERATQGLNDARAVAVVTSHGPDAQRETYVATVHNGAITFPNILMPANGTVELSIFARSEPGRMSLMTGAAGFERSSAGTMSAQAIVTGREQTIQVADAKQKAEQAGFSVTVNSPSSDRVPLMSVDIPRYQRSEQTVITTTIIDRVIIQGYGIIVDMGRHSTDPQHHAPQ